MAFIKSNHRLAFDSVIRILKSDPALSREIKNWNIPDGSPSARANVPTSSNTPYASLDPKPGDSNWADTECMRTPLLIDVMAVFDGTDVRVGMDFSQAVVRALFPTDPTRVAEVKKLLNDVIRGVYVTKFTFGTAGKEGGLFLQATGQIRLEIFLDTTDPRAE